MKIKIRQFLLLLMIAIMSSFTFVPPTHCIPDNNRFVPEVVYEIPPLGSLTLVASNLTAKKGEEVCVAVTTKDFEKILSMQYSMKWDEKVLKFKEIKGFTMPGLSKNNFGAQMAGQGILTFSWYDPDLRGASKPDGFQLYEVCFEAIGERGKETKFEFTSKPTVIEITNAGSVFLDLKTEGGLIKLR